MGPGTETVAAPGATAEGAGGVIAVVPKILKDNMCNSGDSIIIIIYHWMLS